VAIACGVCWSGNVHLDREGEEIKHFNYSRLVGGASYRQQSCNKDR